MSNPYNLRLHIKTPQRLSESEISVKVPRPSRQQAQSAMTDNGNASEMTHIDTDTNNTSDTIPVDNSELINNPIPENDETTTTPQVINSESDDSSGHEQLSDSFRNEDQERRHDSRSTNQEPAQFQAAVESTTTPDNSVSIRSTAIAAGETRNYADTKSIPSTSVTGENSEMARLCVLFQSMNENLFESIKSEIKSVKFELNKKIDSGNETLKSELNNKIDAGNEALKREIESVKSGYETLRHEMGSVKRELNNKIESESQNLKEAFHLEITECRESFDIQIQAINQEQETFREELIKVKEVQTKQQLEIQNIESQLTEKVENQAQKVYKEIGNQIVVNNNILTKQIDSIKNDQETKLNSITKELHENISPLIGDNQSRINKQELKLDNLNSEIQKHENRLDSLQNQLEKRPTGLPAVIQVACQGSAGLMPDIPLPRFHGRSVNPPEFLVKLKKYYEKSITRRSANTNDRDHLIDIIESSLDGHASRWFCLIKEDITKWDEFEQAFLTHYFSKDVQRGIKQKLESDRYRPQGKLSRAEYFVERVLLLKSLTPPMSEDEIISVLADQFEPIIQDARRVQHIETIKDFEALLQREDIKETQRHTRTSHANNHNQHHNENYTNKNQHQNNYGNRFNVNPQAYQPRNQQDFRSPPNRQNHYDNRPTQNNYNQNYYQRNNNYRPQNNGSPNHRPHSPNRNNRNHSPRRYTTPESNQVCTTVVERSDNPRSSPQPSDTLQGNASALRSPHTGHIPSRM